MPAEATPPPANEPKANAPKAKWGARLRHRVTQVEDSLESRVTPMAVLMGVLFGIVAVLFALDALANPNRYFG